MKKYIFNSKRLYFANLIFCIFLLSLTILSLYLINNFTDDNLRAENKNQEIILYSVYFVIYTCALIVLFTRLKKTLVYLNILFSFAIILNIFDCIFHFSEHNSSLLKFISLFISFSFMVGFSVLIYFNNRKRESNAWSELDEIGTQ